jgi:hypothetical protein
MTTTTTRMSWALVPVLLVAAGSIACGGGERTATNTQVTGARGPDGVAATYHAGPLPAPQGALTITVPASGTAINGGSTMITVSATSEITSVYVAIEGADGYWEIQVPAGTTVADVLLTLAQQLPDQIRIVFEVADAAGNVSSPVTMDTGIVKVGTGDIQISVTWNADNDIDLHVIDPLGFEIYYNANVSDEGGELDLDSNPDCSIDHINNENVVWPSGTAPTGTYSVLVANYMNCTGLATSYAVTVQKKGQPPMTFMGSYAADDAGIGGGAGTGDLVTTFTYP